MVPVTRVLGWMHVPVGGGGMEPIGTRIIETLEELERVEVRDSEASFLAYVPTGAVARGETLVTTGGNGRTVACTVCHGPDLRGLGPVPAGRPATSRVSCTICRSGCGTARGRT